MFNYHDYRHSVYTAVDRVMRRGSLAILESAGIILLIRAIAQPNFNESSAIIGGAMLSIGVVLECIIWRISLMASTLQLENEHLRHELHRALEKGPKGI
jgi:hypothetical protein